MQLRLRPFFKDVSLTFVSQLLTLVAFFYTMRLIAAGFGPDGVGEYSLIKRGLGALLPVLLLGQSVGLPRFMSLSNSAAQRGGYVKAGGLSVLLLTASILCLFNIFDTFFAQSLFGNVAYSSLLVPISLFIVGTTLHGFVSSCLRGRSFVVAFNLLEIINTSLVPLCILLLVGGLTVSKLFTLMGICSIFVAVLFFLPIIREAFLPNEQMLRETIMTLLAYSLPRFLNSFLYGVFLSLGPLCASHYVPIRKVGYLSIGQSLLGTVGAIVSPLGLILLPKIGALICQKREAEITENLAYLIDAIIYCSTFILFQMLVFTEPIVRFWLGADFVDSVAVMRIIFCSIPFFLFCGATGSVLEASSVKPLNLLNLSLSFVVAVALAVCLLAGDQVVDPIYSISLSFTFGIVCLGGLSYKSLRMLYPCGSGRDLQSLVTALAINVILGGISMLVEPLVGSSIVGLAIFEICMATSFVTFLWVIKTDWVRRVPERVLLKS